MPIFLRAPSPPRRRRRRLIASKAPTGGGTFTLPVSGFSNTIAFPAVTLRLQRSVTIAPFTVTTTWPDVNVSLSVGVPSLTITVAFADVSLQLVPAGRAGTLAGTLGELTCTSTATADVAGVLVGTLGAVTLTSTATADLAGTLAGTLEAIALVADGTVALGGGTLGDLAQTLAALTGTATGTVDVLAVVAVTLTDVTSVSTGTADVAGLATVTLEALTSSATATVPATGTLALTLDSVGIVATGRVLTGLDILTTTLPNAVSGLAYSQTIVAAGGSSAAVFSLLSGSLPLGLSLAPTGTIAGLPGLLGALAPTSVPNAISGVAYTQTIALAGSSASYNFTVRATDDEGTTDDQAYTVGLSATPPTIALVSGALPPGLTLAATGALTGTPPLLAVIAPTSLPSLQSGIPYSQQVALVGGSATYAFVVRATSQGLSPPDQAYTIGLSNDPAVFTLLSGVLPPGITLSSTGLIAGTTSVSGGAPMLSPATLPPGFVDTVFTQLLTVTTTGGSSYPITVRATTHGLTADQAYTLAVVDWDDPGGYTTFAVVVGRTPSCVSLKPNGLLQGPPMQVATTTFTVRATDRVGHLVEQTYTLAATSLPRGYDL